MHKISTIGISVGVSGVIQHFLAIQRSIRYPFGKPVLSLLLSLSTFEPSDLVISGTGSDQITSSLLGSLLVFSVFVILLVYRAFSSSITRLSNSAGQLEAGSWHNPIRFEGPGQVKKLADQFNVLAAQMASTLEQQAQLQKTIDELVITDALTGVYNRRELNRLLHQEFQRAKRFDRPLSLILFDIDNFKHINDRFGYLTGDETLKSLSTIVANNTRGTNFLARFGGDEFVILLPETHGQKAFYAAERVRKLVAKHPLSLADHAGRPIILPITISLGIAELTEEMFSVQDLFNAADRALYHAKQRGKNQCSTAQERIKSTQK